MTKMLSRSGQTDPGGKVGKMTVQAISAPMIIGLPDETRGQLASLAQMAGVSPNDLAVRLLSDVVSQKFSMAQSFVRQRLLEHKPDTV